VSGFADLLVTIVSFVAVLSVVVTVHELGHFWAGRVNGVAVEAFSLGWGKSLLEWRDRSGVRWKLGRWPIGGFVKFKGDENAASFPVETLYEDPQRRASAREAGILQAMPVWVRAVVSVAGPIANFLFAILVFALIFMAAGRVSPSMEPRIDSVVAGSPAEAGGLRSGDLVLSVDGQETATFAAFQDLARSSPGKAIRLQVYGADGVARSVVVTPDAVEELTQTGESRTVGVLGVRTASRIERLGPLAAVQAGAARTGEIIANQVGFLSNLVTGRASPEHLAGPIGIADLSGQVAKGAAAGGGDPLGVAARVLLSMAELSAFLSVAIGFINLLPIPLLDGGALLFYAAEAVRGRPLGAKAQAIGFNVGLLFVGMLFLLATWNDLQRVVDRF